MLVYEYYGIQCMWPRIVHYRRAGVIHTSNVVIKGLVDKCDHALWRLNLNLIGYNLALG